MFQRYAVFGVKTHAKGMFWVYASPNSNMPPLHNVDTLPHTNPHVPILPGF